MSDDEDKVCGGNVEIWDQTVGCPECGEELWNYPGMEKLGLTTEQYEERFFRMHPFMFDTAHDPGDEDTQSDEIPIGGYSAAYNRHLYGNRAEYWIK